MSAAQEKDLFIGILVFQEEEDADAQHKDQIKNKDDGFSHIHVKEASFDRPQFWSFSGTKVTPFCPQTTQEQHYRRPGFDELSLRDRATPLQASALVIFRSSIA